MRRDASRTAGFCWPAHVLASETWQQIDLIDFDDRARARTVAVQVVC